MADDQKSFIVVVTTCANNDEAQSLASGLVESRLAACVQASKIQSTYRWQGAIEIADEIRLMIKSKASDYQAIEDFIKRKHSYTNPEIIAVPIGHGSHAYLDWIVAETKE